MKIFPFVWKTGVVLLALIVGSFFSVQVGWSGGELILTGWRMGVVEALVVLVLFALSAFLLAGCMALIQRTAKRALWLATPICLYGALVLGVWDGFASDFDGMRANLLKHGFDANAYDLKHMSARARMLTCKEGRVEPSDDAWQICIASLKTGGREF